MPDKILVIFATVTKTIEKQQNLVKLCNCMAMEGVYKAIKTKEFLLVE